MLLQSKQIMNQLLKQSNLLYTFIITIIFFSGFDGSLLYQRTFLDNKTYTHFEYAHFFLALVGGWFIGYFSIQKIVYKYHLNYIFRVSLLISSLSIWIQYKTNHHSTLDMFSQTIINNLFCSILLGLLSYSLMRLIKNPNKLEYIKRQNIYSLIIIILGFFYSETLTEETLNSGFLISSLIYLIAYLVFLKNNVEKINLTDKLNPLIPILSATVIILISIFIVSSRRLEYFYYFSEESSPILVYVFFLFYEAIQHSKNKIS